MVVPVGREPEPRTLEADESGSFLKALQGCVGGPIEPLSWLFDDAPAGYCSEEGTLGATFLDANRAVYADKAMEDAGFLSQLDFATPVWRRARSRRASPPRWTSPRERPGSWASSAPQRPCARAPSTPSWWATWCLPGSTPRRGRAATSPPEECERVRERFGGAGSIDSGANELLSLALAGRLRR